MKKFFSMLLCIIISLGMIFTMSGCGEDATIIGTWANEIDATTMINGYLGLDDEMSQYIKFDEFIVTVNVTFNENGTYKMSIDEEATNESFQKVKKAVSDGLYKYLEDIIKEAGYDITVEEFLEFAETDFDTMLNETINDGAVNQMINIMQAEGKYKVEENKLYMTETADDEFDNEKYQVFTLTDDTLTLTESVGDETESEESTQDDDEYPKIFKRVK